MNHPQAVQRKRRGFVRLVQPPKRDDGRRETVRVKLTNDVLKGIEAPDEGQWLIFDTEVKEFALRVLADTGRMTYIVNLMRDGQLFRRTIGHADRMTADEARIEAKKIIGQLANGHDELQEKRVARAEARTVAIAAADAKVNTLRRLCELYVDDLKRRKRSADRDALSLFRNHVFTQPDADKPAREITRGDVAGILRRIIDQGHGRTAAKVRSYIRAAYQRALAAEGDPTVHADLLAFRLEYNPAANTASLSQFNVARERKLKPAELSSILKHLAADDRVTARAAYLCVLLGGQRPAQLLRATVAQFDPDKGLLTLLDGKGRRQKPRKHVVPVIGPALPLMKTLHADAVRAKCRWLFTSDGKTAVRAETVSGVIANINAELIEAAGADAPEPFSLRDLRAAVETLLAEGGVSKEVRAQLLSHGLAGVQDRHYNRHEYLDEKVEALKLLHARVAELMKKRAKRG